MNRLTLLLCLFGLAWSQVSAALDAEGIIGGEYAEEDDFKYQVSLQVFGQSICGGSIIADKYVLTAAHCVKKPNGQFNVYPYKVVVGTNDLNTRKNAVEVAVETVYSHKNYNALAAINDIAILKLKKGLGLGSNPHIEKINLPKAGKNYAGVTAVISGYGWQSIEIGKNSQGQWVEKGGKSDKKLKFADVKILTNTICKQKNWPQTIHESNICGQVVQRGTGSYEGICSGDSGGPLVYGDEVIGVVSTSPFGCDETRKAAPYTRVTSFLSFIHNVLNGVSSSEIDSVRVSSGWPLVG